MSIRPYLGSNVNPASVDEIRFRGLLNEDETLLALFDGVLLDQNGRRVGGLALSDFVILTDQRLITWARGFFNDTVDGFEWKDVDIAEAGTWDPFHGRVGLAFRLAPVAPRARRIALKGTEMVDPGSDGQVLINTLDFMPAEDVAPLARMVEWIGDQVVTGVQGEALLNAFAEQFPAPEQTGPTPFFAAPPPAPPPPAPPPQAPVRKRWWQLGAREEEVMPSGALPDNPASLVAAYESQRSGRPVDPNRLPATVSGEPLLPEQPSMYDVSRSLRLMLEAPRRLVRSLRRAGEIASGASELVSGMQDPRVRRNAIAGMRQAVEQHEQKKGPLTPVAPLARAVLAFSEPLENELPQQTPSESRRIQVRASVRNRPTIETASEAPTVPDVAPTPTSPVRRSVTVRRVEPEGETAQYANGSNGAQHDMSPANGQVPIDDTADRPAVRRIVINRSEE